MPIDVLIIGQGLAGSLLAWELLQRGLRVMVIDNGASNASKVAAGLINPVTGQRLVKSHAVDVLLPEAMALYRQLAEHFDQAFFVSKAMLRVLSSTKQRQLAEQRLFDNAYRDYLDTIVEATPTISSPHGILRQRHTGYLRTVAILDCMREFLLANASYLQCEFNYAELAVQPTLQWRDLQPRQLVFCEGHRLVDNPWFGRLPLQPVKGEILHCKTAASSVDAILNYGFWLIPDDRNGFKTGATFDTDVVDQQASTHAKQRLLQALSAVCPELTDVQVVKHQAGIRPTTLDKQPFVGSHPRHDNLHVFNGFGAKGSLAIPYYARRLAEALTRQVRLPVDCDIRRYHDTHFAG